MNALTLKESSGFEKKRNKTRKNSRLCTEGVKCMIFTRGAVCSPRVLQSTEVRILFFARPNDFNSILIDDSAMY
jgi:hypothetical protein